MIRLSALLPTGIQQLRLTFDYVTRHPEHDLGSTLGLLLALQQTLRLQRSGLLWMGPPCSSFGFMASSCHKRTMVQPMGDTTRQFVRTGNLLSSRATLLALVALSRSVFYFLENPGQTMLEYFPYVRFLMSLDYLNCRLTQGLTVRWWPV